MPEAPAPSTAGMLSNRRTFPRYPAWLDARVHTIDGPTSAPGTLIDISEGGALVLTQPGFAVGASVGLTLVLSSHHFTLDGVVLLAEGSWMGEMLHVRFHPWPPRERLLLLKLIDDLHTGFEEHQVAIWTRTTRAPKSPARAPRALQVVSEQSNQVPARGAGRRRTRP